MRDSPRFDITGDDVGADRSRLMLHYGAFIIVYALYGYQVCPFLDDLTLAQLVVPPAFAIVVHFGLRSVWFASTRKMALNCQASRMFWGDWLLFIAMGAAVGAYNTIVHDFPGGSAAKVIIGFTLLGLYIALDLALRHDLAIARHLRSSNADLPIDGQFLPYKTRFMLFSAINIATMALVAILVAVKDLVWVRDTELDQGAIQLLVFVDTAVVVGILGTYIMIVIRQYAQKIEFAMAEETIALTAVRSGNLSSRVAVVSNDEFGQLATLTNDMIARLGSSLEDVARSQHAAIKALVSLAAKRDNETGMHLARTQKYVALLAEQLKDGFTHREELDPETMRAIVDAAPLHDIGKVGIPDAILLKPGRLERDEFTVMQTHTSIGADALIDAGAEIGASIFVDTAIDIARHHHERWDGTGYPDGLAGQDIPLAARIMAVADVYDAIRSQRAYKPARPHADARQIIVDGSGNHFDPDIVNAFLLVEDKFADIAETHRDEMEPDIHKTPSIALA